MRKVAVLLSAFFVLAAGFAQTGQAPIPRHRIIVGPKDTSAPVAATLARLHATLGTNVRRAFPRIGGLQIVELPDALSMAAVIDAFERSGAVRYVEPDQALRLFAAPNDLRYQDGTLWNLHNNGTYGGTPGADIRAETAWEIRHDAPDVIVAVVDTGIRYTHEDLAANMWINPGEIGLDPQGRDKRTNGIDDDGNGFIDDVHGINAITGSGDPNDDYGHGSHVAGTIGGVGNNLAGVTGVAWRVQLMACKLFDSAGNATVSDAIVCLDYARAMGARVVNASWGGDSFTSQALLDTFMSLRDAGIIVAAAAGNNGRDNDVTPQYPASYDLDNIVSVAATDRTDTRAGFSNYGLHTVALGAPGSPIYSCWKDSDQDYRYYDGTSMATPHVAGAAALLWAQYPNDDYRQIVQRILLTTDPLPSLLGVTKSGGRLDLTRAMLITSISAAPVPSIVLPREIGSAANTVWCDDQVPGGSYTLASGGDEWTWINADPVPISGQAAHQSSVAAGLHEHAFTEASETLSVLPGDLLYAYVYLDPANPPRSIMLSWQTDTWEHRAFWGEDLFTSGTYGTTSRYDMGALPAAGQWVRLEVPAAAVGLENATLNGMGFALFGGRATWDAAGRKVR